MDNLVTIITFTYPYEVAIAQGRLESEGIECFVRDEMMASIYPFYSNAIGGIKLQVRESDVPIAIEILIDGGFIEENKEEDKSAETGTTEVLPVVGFRCPFCGSDEIVRSTKVSAFASIFSLLLLNVPVPFSRRNYHCMDCGKDFKKIRWV